MYRSLQILFAAFLIFAFCAMPLFAGEALPKPQISGGQGLFDSLAKRSSPPGANFPVGAVSREELSTILWAATGLNRPEKGWTVPMAMGTEPYASVYVAGPEGTFLYDWKNHELLLMTETDARDKIGKQPFVSSAPYVLIFVSKPSVLASRNNADINRLAPDWANVAVGAMTQNVYLAAGALGIGVRYAASLNESAVREACALEGAQAPICIMPMGKH